MELINNQQLNHLYHFVTIFFIILINEFKIKLMKKITLLFTLLMSYSMMAQLVSPEIPDDGLVYNYTSKSGLLDGINDGSLPYAGPWDLTGESGVTGEDVVSLLPVSASDYAADYPNATHVKIEDGFEFFVGHSSDAYTFHGERSFITSAYSEPLYIHSYPFDIGMETQYDQVYEVPFTVPGGPPFLFRDDSSSAQVVAQSSLTLPDGSIYENAVLIVLIRTFSDGQAQSTPCQTDLTQYLWMEPGNPMPLAITYTQESDGINCPQNLVQVSKFRGAEQEPPSEPTAIFFEDFETSFGSGPGVGVPPSNWANGWTTFEALGSSGDWVVNSTNNVGVPDYGGDAGMVSGGCIENYALLDSDGYGSGASQDASLISPVIDLSGYTNLTLSYNHHIRNYSATEGYVESSIDGVNWSEIVNYNGLATSGAASIAEGLESFDISSLAGNASVQIRFRFVGAWEYYWGVDNISITTTDALSISENTLLDMVIYPNPVDGDYVTIQTPLNGDKLVEVFDVNGRKVMERLLTTDTLNVSSISAGMYIVKVTVEDQSNVSKLIIE